MLILFCFRAKGLMLFITFKPILAILVKVTEGQGRFFSVFGDLKKTPPGNPIFKKNLSRFV